MKGEFLRFKGVNDLDIYNPTAPFVDNGVRYIAARVESRDDESNSKVMLFREVDKEWVLDDEAPVFDLQDPFVTRVNGELIFGGVKLEFIGEELDYYKTVFYRGKNISELDLFAEGPERMKDIRLIELPEGIGVFTRPQGGDYGEGKIGFMIIDSLNSLNDCNFYSAEIIKEQFNDDEWGGVNEVHYLQDNLLGVLGHIANREFRKGIEIKHYYPIAFKYDYFTREATPLKIIARRSDFPPEPSKRSPELDDVLFTGGLTMMGKGLAELVVGISDARAGMIIIKDSFS